MSAASVPPKARAPAPRPAAPPARDLPNGFVNQEIGSLPKALWRNAALGKAGVKASDLDDAKAWAKRLDIDATGLLALLARIQKAGHATAEEKEEVKRWASLYGIRFLEHMGLDLIYDGEQHRIEMYEHPVRRTEGFEMRGQVRSFDNRYYNKAAVVAPPVSREPYHVDEFQVLREHARKPVKVPITGAYTLADWTFDEYYLGRVEHKLPPERRRREAREEFIHDVAKHVVRPNNAALIEAGARFIQIDEPAATTKPAEVDLFVSSFNESVKGLSAKFSCHICFSDYNLLFPHIQELKGAQFAPEFANKDAKGLGTSHEDRPGYSILRRFAAEAPQFEIGLGVTDVHNDPIEAPELVRDRILYAVKVLGDPAKVSVNPDCGLRTRSWKVVEEKLATQVAGSRLAARSLGLVPGR